MSNSELVFTINEKDYSALIDKYSYKIDYEIREGENSGCMLDGSWIRDILARKVVITASTVPVLETQTKHQDEETEEEPTLSRLMLELSADTVTVKYTVPQNSGDTQTDSDDNEEGNTRSSLFVPEFTGFQIAIYQNNKILWKSGAKITLTEV